MLLKIASNRAAFSHEPYTTLLLPPCQVEHLWKYEKATPRYVATTLFAGKILKSNYPLNMTDEQHRPEEDKTPPTKNSEPAVDTPVEEMKALLRLKQRARIISEPPQIPMSIFIKIVLPIFFLLGVILLTAIMYYRRGGPIARSIPFPIETKSQTTPTPTLSVTGMSEQPKQVAKDGCIISGCSGEICADEPMFSACILIPELVCYESTICERQANGYCGWTQTPELTSCLNEYRQ